MLCRRSLTRCHGTLHNLSEFIEPPGHKICYQKCSYRPEMASMSTSRFLNSSRRPLTCHADIGYIPVVSTCTGPRILQTSYRQTSRMAEGVRSPRQAPGNYIKESTIAFLICIYPKRTSPIHTIHSIPYCSHPQRIANNLNAPNHGIRTDENRSNNDDKNNSSPYLYKRLRLPRHIPPDNTLVRVQQSQSQTHNQHPAKPEHLRKTTAHGTPRISPKPDPRDCRVPLLPVSFDDQV